MIAYPSCLTGCMPHLYFKNSVSFGINSEPIPVSCTLTEKYSFSKVDVLKSQFYDLLKDKNTITFVMEFWSL